MMYLKFGKRLFDIAAAGCALVALSPVLIATAITIRIEDGGPALFRQLRSGRDGEPFVLYKFRSMPVNTENRASADASTLRITRIGRIIRRTNIDELPQLLNILKGDMSVVGPRPALPTQEILLSRRAATGAIECRPGLTGLAQVNSYDCMPEMEKADFDAEYARSISLRRDLRIILHTFGYLTRKPPVY